MDREKVGRHSEVMPAMRTWRTVPTVLPMTRVPDVVVDMSRMQAMCVGAEGSDVFACREEVLTPYFNSG